MTTRDGSDAPEDEGVSAPDRSSAPADGSRANDETVSTLTGLFRIAREGSGDPADDAASALDDAEAALQRHGIDPSEVPDDAPHPEEPRAEDPAPPTESIRLLSEMFSGFRRAGRADAADLEEVLGTATQSLPVIDDGRVVPSAKADEPQAPAPSSGSERVEPATHAGAIPVVGAPSAHADAPDALTRPAEGDASAAPADVPTQPIAMPRATPTPEPPAPETPREPDPAEPAAPSASAASAPAPAAPEHGAALSWLSSEKVATGQIPVVHAAPALLPARRRRRVGAILAPVITAIVLVLAYVVTFAVLPLDRVAPEVTEADVAVEPAAPLQMPWPEVGQAAVAVEGLDETLTSATPELPETPVSMASLTKVIAVMTILERAPLAPGEQGPSYEFGYADNAEYWAYRYRNESALDVPIGGTLTQYQMLEGILLGSAGNYLNKLVDQLWEYDRQAFTLDAAAWLGDLGIGDISVVDATGISTDNLGTASSLVTVAEAAMEHPVVAEIVAKESVELPGAGLVENSNPLIGEEGIVGIKTGAIFPFPNIWNLMTAKDVETAAGETVRVYSIVLGQESEEGRADATRELLDAVTAQLEPTPVVQAGETIATLTTAWGESTEVVADEAVEIVQWDGETAEIALEYTAGLGAEAGAQVGTLVATSSRGEASTTLSTTDDLEGPSLGWRLTHPLELLGLG